MAEKSVVITQQLLKPIKILKWKVAEKNSMSIGGVILLYDFEGAVKTEQRKLKSAQAGTVYKVLAPEGAIVKQGEPLLELTPCIHPTVMKDMCAECGADLRKDDTITSASVPMVHAIPDLKVSEEVAQKLGKADGDRLLRDRKLVLLVDLDQTLIHTTNDNILPNIKDVYHFQLYGPNSPWYHTRLRPGTHKFLNNVSPLFELHICTFGARNYAHTITMFLDNDQSYFSNRILSRDECFDPTSKKANLKALFPCGDNMVCIIDDREDVWNHASNLIHVKPYHFFQHTGDINAPPGLDKQENDDKDGVDLTKYKKVQKPNGKNNLKIKAHQNGDNTNGNIVNENLDKADGEENLENECNDTIEPKNDEKAETDNDSKLEIEKDAKMDVDNGDKIEDNGIEISPAELNDEKEEEKQDVDMEEEKQNVEMHVEKNGDAEKMTTGETEEKDLDETKEEDLDKTEEKSDDKTKDENGEIKHSDAEKCSEETKSDDDQTDGFKKPCEFKNKDQKEDLIEIDDPDDYLLYLEDILKRIHHTFYEKYDKMESGEVPDLKQVIPNVRSLILKGCRLVFSGLVPTHIKLEQSKAYLVARSLGAIVTQDLEEDSTHLVAVRPGTAKVNAGRRRKNLQIVTPDWLWACAERWEHVDEKIYPLNSKGSKNRHPPPHCSSPEHVPNYPVHDAPTMRKRTPSGRFMDTINPLMSFSSDDIADMDKEVEDILDDESDESEEESPTQKPAEEAKAIPVEVQEESSSSSDESLTGEFPRGFKRTRDKRDQDAADDEQIESSLDEFPSTKFRRGEQLDSDLDIGQESNSEGSVEPPDEVDDGEWNMMGAALEREFLSNN